MIKIVLITLFCFISIERTSASKAIRRYYGIEEPSILRDSSVTASTFSEIVNHEGPLDGYVYLKIDGYFPFNTNNGGLNDSARIHAVFQEILKRKDLRIVEVWAIFSLCTYGRQLSVNAPLNCIRNTRELVESDLTGLQDCKWYHTMCKDESPQLRKYKIYWHKLTSLA